MYPDESDKKVARAILHNTAINPETRLELARKFDPTIKSLHDGTFAQVQEYERSIIPPSGRRPQPRTKREIFTDANGDLVSVVTKGDEVVSYTNHGEEKRKQSK